MDGTSKARGTGREKMLRSVVAMAAADGRIGKRERALLDTLRGRWSLGAQVLQEALDGVEAGTTKLAVPGDPGEQEVLLDALVEMATIDGVIEAAERRMLKAYGERLGLTADAVNELTEAALARRGAKGEEGGDAKRPTSDVGAKPRDTAKKTASDVGVRPTSDVGAKVRDTGAKRAASDVGGKVRDTGAKKASGVGARARDITPADVGINVTAKPFDLAAAFEPEPATAATGPADADAGLADEAVAAGAGGSASGGPPTSARVVIAVNDPRLASYGRIAWPSVCACCLQPPSGTQRLTATHTETRGDVREERTTRVEVPYCADCLHHVRGSDTRFLLALLGTAAVIGAVGLLVVSGFSSIDVLLGQGKRVWVGGGLLSFGAWTLAMGAVRLLRPTPVVDGQHATEGSAVGAFRNRDQVTFTFANPALGAVVAAANMARFEPAPPRPAYGVYDAGTLLGLRKQPAARGAVIGAAAGGALVVLALLLLPQGDARAFSAAERQDDVPAYDEFLRRFPRSPLRGAAMTGRLSAALREALRGSDAAAVVHAATQHVGASAGELELVEQRLVADALELRALARRDDQLEANVGALVRRIPEPSADAWALVAMACMPETTELCETLDRLVDEKGDAALVAVRARIGRDAAFVTEVGARAVELTAFAPLERLLAHVPGAAAQPGVEGAAWKLLRSPEDLERYVALFPSARPHDEVERKRVEFLFSHDRGAGTLPPSDAAGPSGIPGKSVYAVKNDTGHVLSLSFLGPDVRTVSIPVGQVATVELKNGRYRLRASVTAGSVRPFHGEESLVDGRYETAFVVQTEYDRMRDALTFPRPTDDAEERLRDLLDRMGREDPGRRR